MKKVFLLLTLISVISFLQSCDHDEEPGLLGNEPAVYFEVKVINNVGENLLDPTVKGNILDEKMELIVDGISYPVSLSYPNRTIEPVPLNGTHVGWDAAWIGGTDTKFIRIGSFRGSGIYTQEFVLNLAGQNYNLSFNNYYRLHGNNVQHRLLCYENGKEVGEFTGNNSWTGKYTVVLNR